MIILLNRKIHHASIVYMHHLFCWRVQSYAGWKAFRHREMSQGELQPVAARNSAPVQPYKHPLKLTWPLHGLVSKTGQWGAHEERDQDRETAQSLEKANAKSSTSQWLCSYVLHSHLEHFSLVCFSLCWPFSFSPPCCLPGSKQNWLLCLWSTSEHVGWNNFQPLLILHAM